MMLDLISNLVRIPVNKIQLQGDQNLKPTQPIWPHSSIGRPSNTMWLKELHVFSLKLATFPSLENNLPIVAVLLSQLSSYEIDTSKTNI